MDDLTLPYITKGQSSKLWIFRYKYDIQRLGSTGMSLPGISGLHLTPQVHWGLNWPKKSGFKWFISIIVALIYHELPIVGWSNPGIYLPKLGISTSTISTGMNSETEQLIGIHSISIDQRVPNQGVFPINIAMLWGYHFLKTSFNAQLHN